MRFDQRLLVDIFVTEIRQLPSFFRDLWLLGTLNVRSTATSATHVFKCNTNHRGTYIARFASFISNSIHHYNVHTTMFYYKFLSLFSTVDHSFVAGDITRLPIEYRAEYAHLGRMQRLRKRGIMWFVLGLMELSHVLTSYQRMVPICSKSRLFGCHFVTLLSEAECCHARWVDGRADPGRITLTLYTVFSRLAQ